MVWAEFCDSLLVSCSSGVVTMLNIEPNSSTIDIETNIPNIYDDDFESK